MKTFSFRVVRSPSGWFPPDRFTGPVISVLAGLKRFNCNYFLQYTGFGFGLCRHTLINLFDSFVRAVK